MVYRSTNKNMNGDRIDSSKEFERLLTKLNYQNTLLKENISELFTLSNTLKGRDSVEKGLPCEGHLNSNDIIGSLWSETYRTESLNDELREIVNHFRELI